MCVTCRRQSRQAERRRRTTPAVCLSVESEQQQAPGGQQTESTEAEWVARVAREAPAIEGGRS
eukprot:COSAG01_NODE_659_length_14436_cov_15.108112_1_plen_62_part_10